jgi:citrate lyase subunit beta/citryl-CoA lyase
MRLPLRSLLFVPGDSEKKMAKSAGVPADAIILDLEDAVAPQNLPGARALVREYLVSRPDRSRQQLWARINPVDSPHALPDLAAIVGGAPDGIVVPKARSVDDCDLVSQYLLALEHREGVAPGSIRILAVAPEIPQAMLTADSWSRATPRMLALTWGAEDMAAALGATRNRDEAGEYEFTYRMARSTCLIAAHAAGLQAIDTLTMNFRDPDQLRRDVKRARSDGFTGKIAIHPDQVAIINEGFTPDADEIARAQRVVEAFASAGTGVAQLDGRMLDRPHVVQAERVLALAARAMKK